jgi:hypothetical protein
MQCRLRHCWWHLPSFNFSHSNIVACEQAAAFANHGTHLRRAGSYRQLAGCDLLHKVCHLRHLAAAFSQRPAICGKQAATCGMKVILCNK